MTDTNIEAGGEFVQAELVAANGDSPGFTVSVNVSEWVAAWQLATDILQLFPNQSKLPPRDRACVMIGPKSRTSINGRQR